MNEAAGKQSSGNKRFGLTKMQWGLIVGIVFAAIGSYVGTQLASGNFGSATSIDKQLLAMTNEINKSCPLVMDQDTRLDNTSAGPGRMITYNYTLVNLSIEKINVDEFRDYIQPRVINNARTSDDMKYFRENEVTLRYKYSDKNGNFVFDVKVTPEDYK